MSKQYLTLKSAAPLNTAARAIFDDDCTGLVPGESGFGITTRGAGRVNVTSADARRLRDWLIENYPDPVREALPKGAIVRITNNGADAGLIRHYLPVGSLAEVAHDEGGESRLTLSGFVLRPGVSGQNGTQYVRPGSFEFVALPASDD